MYCHKCGAKREGATRFCIMCGEKFPLAAVPESAVAVDPTPQAVPDHPVPGNLAPAGPGPSHRAHTTALIATLAIVTAGLGIVSAVVAFVFAPVIWAGIVFTLAALVTSIVVLCRPGDRRTSSLWCAIVALVVACGAGGVMGVSAIARVSASIASDSGQHLMPGPSTASPAASPNASSGASGGSGLYDRATMESYVLDPANWLFYPPETAACPDTIDVTPGVTFTCDVTFDDGTTTKVYARVLGADGSVTWGSFPP